MVCYSIQDLNKNKARATIMETMNKLMKWSAIIGGMSGLMVLGVIFSTWLVIEMMALMVGITS